VLELEAEDSTRGVGKALSQIWQKFVGGSIVGAIMRDSQLIIPDGSSVIRSGDKVIVFALPEAIADVERLFLRK